MSDPVRLGIFYTIVRPEEKALLAAAEAHGLSPVRLADADLTFPLERPDGLPDVVVNRSVSHVRSVYATRAFAHYGIRTVNDPETVDLAGDKIRTSLRLQERGIPTPRTVVALSPEAALRALEEVGYPAVLKPAVGSWGRLMAKVHSPEEAEQLIEHKAALGAPIHSIFYAQAYVPKPGRDLRAFVVGDQVLAAMWRASSDWRTNAARGATATAAPLTSGLTDLALRAAEAVGGGVLAVDLMEAPEGLVVHEVNPTPEFRTLQSTTDVDLASAIVEHAVGLGRA